MSRSTRLGRSERRPSRAKASEWLSWREVGLGRLDAVPDDLRRLSAAFAREERAAPQHGMRFPQRDHHPDEPEEAGVPLPQRPVDPTDRIILAPGVVVAVLGAQELVARQDHRHALRDHEGRHQVPDLPAADREHGRIVGRSLDAAVPAPVGVAAVAVPLAVGLVVFLVVGDQVVQGEAVVAADEVDRVERSAACVEVVAAAESRGQGRGHAGIAAPESPDVVAIPAVPVRPAPLAGKGADLVEPGGVPGLGDQLGVAEQRVLGDAA